MTIDFDVTVVASSLHDADAVDRLTEPFRTMLESVGGHRRDDRRPGVVRPDEVPPGDGDRPRVILVATGGTEDRVLAVTDGWPPYEPVVLLAHGAHNSLPAALESLAALHQRARRGRIVQLTGAERDVADVAEVVGDLDAVRRFRHARIGLVGGASSWLAASSPDPHVVATRWGSTVEVVAPETVVQLTRSATPAATTAFAERFPEPDGGRGSMPTVTSVAVRDASAVGAALADVASNQRFDAVAVRCFDLLDDPGTSGCLGLAGLNDDGIVAGCEGDLPSTLALMWARFLLDQPAWMANPQSVDVASNRVELAHCTIAPSMTEGVTLSTHFESGIGVGISGRLAPQPVTLVRIGGRELDQVWLADGHIVASGDDPDRCRTQATVELVGADAGNLLERPLGNHLTLLAGHHRDRLQRWWHLAIA